MADLKYKDSRRKLMGLSFEVTLVLGKPAPCGQAGFSRSHLSKHMVGI